MRLSLISRLGHMMRWFQARVPHIQSLQLEVGFDEGETEDGHYHMLLEAITTVLLAGGRLQHLRRLHVCQNNFYSLTYGHLAGLSLGRSLEVLKLDIPPFTDMSEVVDVVGSLRNLQLCSIRLGEEEMMEQMGPIMAAGSRALLTALCKCKQLRALDLVSAGASFSLGRLPSVLATATCLTALQLREAGVHRMDSAPRVLPTSLQRLRLTDTRAGSAALSALPTDLSALKNLSELHIAVQDFYGSIGRFPTRLRSLRLEYRSTDKAVDPTPQQRAAVVQLSALAYLETLALDGIPWLDKVRAELAAALAPLLHLRALALTSCNLTALPAAEALNRISTLSLHDNKMTSLPDVPSGTLQRLIVLDVGLNHLGTSIALVSPANLAAIGSYTSLRALGMFPVHTAGLTMELTRENMSRLCSRLATHLQQQAANAEPPRPTVAIAGVALPWHMRLLRSALTVGCISEVADDSHVDYGP